jgi:hypothetical protein
MSYLTFLISMPGGSEWILLLLIVIPLYFLPAIVANNRKHPNSGPILVINLLLGWTFLGWVGALVWALSSTGIQGPTVVVNNAPHSYAQENPSEAPAASTRSLSSMPASDIASYQDKIDQLRQLKQLLDEGVLTSEEFNRQKLAILS